MDVGVWTADVEDVDGFAAVVDDVGVCTAAAVVACAALVVDDVVELELVVDALDVDDDVAAGCATIFPIPPKLQALAPCCGPKLL